MHITTILILLFFFFLVYVGVHWGMGWYSSAKAQEVMTSVILENAESTSDEKLKEVMAEALRNEAKIQVALEDLVVLRGAGGKEVSAEFLLKHRVDFPPTEWGFDLTFKPKVLEDVSKRGFR